MTESSPPFSSTRLPGSARRADGGGGAVVDLRRYRLARMIRDAGRQQGELARMMRDSARERGQMAEALQGAQRHLASLAATYKVLMLRLKREKDFRDACQAAAELGDLDEMIRRRDALALELEAIRRPTDGAGQ
ncbi:hypothetical protein [Azospirillum picis]|uniref:Uncharacterized protein n=1 Tax=Azospirillum picis TaxID=488438 RepID=A0ABU0MLD4_9PROT|nr:hypothetical protein [Azospirillum picis]MBP2300472.1 hypothetical protein [Azospirillum picis]MDQ0534268.1 hypothetical protein [Azospirillum picis]